MSERGDEPMELDALKASWAETSCKLDDHVQLDRALRADNVLSRARSSMQLHVAGLGIEAVLNAIVLLPLGSFMFTHSAEPRFLLPALVLHVFAILTAIDLVRQIRAAGSIDYGQPVATIQRQLERVGMLRVRHVQRVLLVAALLWTPLLIVALRGLFGIDAYRVFGSAWLGANVAFGVAVIPIAIAVSRAVGPHMARGGAFRRLLSDIGGQSLARARAALARLTEFERE